MFARRPAGTATRCGAASLLEDEVRAAGWRELEVSFVPVERGARGFWERCGFVDTGRVHDGEPVYRKDL